MKSPEGSRIEPNDNKLEISNEPNLHQLRDRSFNLNYSAKELRFCPNLPDNLKQLVAFLGQVEDLNRTRETAKEALIIYVDDSELCRTQMKIQIEMLGMSNRLRMFSDGH